MVIYGRSPRSIVKWVAAEDQMGFGSMKTQRKNAWLVELLRRLSEEPSVTMRTLQVTQQTHHLRCIERAATTPTWPNSNSNSSSTWGWAVTTTTAARWSVRRSAILPLAVERKLVSNISIQCIDRTQKISIIVSWQQNLRPPGWTTLSRWCKRFTSSQRVLCHPRLICAPCNHRTSTPRISEAVHTIIIISITEMVYSTRATRTHRCRIAPRTRCWLLMMQVLLTIRQFLTKSATRQTFAWILTQRASSLPSRTADCAQASTTLNNLTPPVLRKVAIRRNITPWVAVVVFAIQSLHIAKNHENTWFLAMCRPSPNFK